MSEPARRPPGAELPMAGSPAAPGPRAIEPYRVLFPFGYLFALLGVGLWPAAALGWLPYPAALHRSWMLQGFEMSFMLGFLLTAMPGFTHGEKCRSGELRIALFATSGFTLASLAGLAALAAASFVLATLLPLVAFWRRLRRAPVPPAVELAFVLYGLALGALGGLFQLAQALGMPELSPRFAERMIAHGMVLPIVIGVGGLLVPVFAGIRKPLAIPGVAGPHERGGRFALYIGVLTLFALAIAFEPLGQGRLAALLRALGAGVMLVLVWKIWRLPGLRTVPAYAMWASGWCLLAGLSAAAAAPRYALAGLHLAFIGGYGLLTLSIATRVIVAHGKHGLEQEARTLTAIVGGLVIAAVALRIGADVDTARTLPLLGASGALWMIAWLWWGARALPRLFRIRG